jgi:predicted nucleotidyltransferase
MTDRDYEVARKLKLRCSKLVSLVEIRVFGSRARGDNEIDSDLDVFVEVERLDRKIRRLIQDTAWEIGLDYSLVIAPIVFSRDEIERLPSRSSPILEAVRGEGITV